MGTGTRASPLDVDDGVRIAPNVASVLCKASVLLNVVLLLIVFMLSAAVVMLSAADAKVTLGPRGPAVSALDESRAACSGHGMLFSGADACECFDCWTGSTCELRITNASECIVNANSGTPFIFEEYWVQHPEATVSIKPSYHIGYGADMPRLEAAIRSLHTVVGNAVADDSVHVVVGLGSTELINAALYALSEDDAAQPAAVWSQAPYYSGYRSPPSFFHTRNFEWVDAGNSGTPPHDRRVIELVTSPNNPDGHLRSPAVHGPHSAVVMDHAYLWPHFVAVGHPPISYAGNATVALFTLSKVSGHASSRVGWALTSSASLARRLRAFVSTVSYGVPRENQLRAIAVIEHMVTHRGQPLRIARRLMQSRWERLEAAFAAHAARCAGGRAPCAASPYQLEPRDAPAPDAFSGEAAYAPSPAYAWVRRSDGGDCLAAMRGVGIIARPGTQFGASQAYARLELLMREPTFDILLSKLQTLLGVD